jgi:D-serine deaminase-like pyridoxal phosphate-dependent protein
VRLGISHPCSTLDRWQVLALVDDSGRVVEAMPTRF